ncbi:hypothetical protein HanRHA438_Chr16g0768601 [Helianthus annuus]|nr:hypothetical protein HanRHA438_Chr16g0768601 [Helianthus annuus]
MLSSSSFPPNTHHRSPPATHPLLCQPHFWPTKHRSPPPYYHKEEDLLVCGSDGKRRRD